jgi:dipeptidyl aminopeptidase/acylaminoacyl peptidase
MTELTAELIVDLAVLSDVVLSPDGSRVAYTVKPVGKKEEHPLSAIWVAQLDGSSPPRRLTVGAAEDRAPLWSPDGRQLAFLSDRARRGTMQLYVINMEGGEARPLTPVKNKRPVLRFNWSPTGGTIAFTSADEPDDEDERREKEKDDPEVFGERWPHARLRVVSVDSEEITGLASGPRHIAEFAWSPDGDALAWFSWQAPPLEFAGRTVRFERIAANGGTPQTLGEFPHRADALIWSSDGETLLFLGVASGRAQASSVVWALPATGGEPRRLALGEDSCATGLQQPRGLQQAIVSEAFGLETRLCYLDTETGAVEPFYFPSQFSEPGEITGWSVQAVNNQLHSVVAVAVVRSSSSQPPEIWAEVMEPDSSTRAIRISNHQAALKDVLFAAQEPFLWQASDGLALDGILIHPPSKTLASEDGRLPMITLVHGGPYGRSGQALHLGWGAWGQWLALAGYLVLLPNPRGGLGHGDQFASAARGDVGGVDYGDVMAAVDAAIARGLADPERLGIGGWSQGGFMTAWAVTQTNRFKAGVMGAGPSDWGMMAMTSDLPDFEAELGGSVPWDGIGPHRHAQLSPISFARNVRTPVLILHGKEDARVPVTQAIGYHRALREAGVVSEMVIYPREPHGIAERAHQLDLLRRVRAWYARWL